MKTKQASDKQEQLATEITELDRRLTRAKSMRQHGEAMRLDSEIQVKLEQLAQIG